MPQTAFEVQPANMVLGQLLTNRITEPRLLAAFDEIPRDLFVPPAVKHAAYADEDLAVGHGRVLLQPLSLAKMLQAAHIQPQHRVLIIGALTGYVVALASKLSSTVMAIENDESWLVSARDNLARLGIKNIELEYVANLADGHAKSGPYDAIIVAGGVEYVPETLLAQLALEGKLLAVRKVSSRPGAGGLGKLTVFSRPHGHAQQHELGDLTGALLPGFAKPEHFTL